MTNGLVALGAAAVLAIYSAGHLRTNAAAEQFEDPSPRRRPAPPPAFHEVLPVLSVESPVSPSGPAAARETAGFADSVPASTPAKPEQTASAASAPTPKTAAAARVTSAGTQKSTAPLAGDAVAMSATATPDGASAAAGPAPGAETMEATAASMTPETSQAAAVPAEPVPQSADPTPVAAAAPATAQYKDGSYTGRGSSRHGDIEATVVIADGRIASASISRCRMRYPCAQIAALPPQVAERQSPEVDYISGATQSINAFYYAVVEALAKAE